jgi:DNA-binding GntR family transcriptional regulator
VDLTALRRATQINDPIERARALTRLMTEDAALVAEAARHRRQAIAEARDRGATVEHIATQLGVSPGRVSQIRKESAGDDRQAPALPDARGPRVLVQRSLPTEPAVRGSIGLFLVEAERQGINADRKMLYIGLEPASEHVAAGLRIEPGGQVVARRKMMLANDVPVRIATSFFRADLFAGTRMAEPGFVRPSLQAALEDLGHRFGHAEEYLISRPPTELEHATLELDSGEWVVQVMRTSYSTENTPVHALETVCAATRHSFPIGQVAGADEF